MAIKKEAAPAVHLKPDRLIYCGPNIPGGVLQRFAIYKGGLPVHLGELFAKNPAVKALFVPVADLAKTEKAIATKGTPESILYQQAMKGGV